MKRACPALERVCLPLTMIIGVLGLGCGESTVAFPAPPPTTARTVVVAADPGQFDDVVIRAGLSQRFVLPSRGVPPAGPFDALELDIDATLGQISIAPPPAPAGVFFAAPAAEALTGTAEVLVRAGLDSEEFSVCDEGEEYGPFTLPLDGGPVLAGAEDVKVEPATVQTINRGAYSICVEVTPTQDASFTIDGVTFEAADCAVPVADVSGIWVGPYECTDSCGPNFGGTVRVQIAQEGINGSYMDDQGGGFKGTVCEQQLRYSGGYGCNEPGSSALVCEEVESGVFVRTGENTALKRSTFTYFDGALPCTGTCNDALTREVAE